MALFALLAAVNPVIAKRDSINLGIWKDGYYSWTSGTTACGSDHATFIAPPTKAFASTTTSTLPRTRPINKW
jgi:hypothetical protein